MHSFEVHSNESACRKKVRLGLEQVYIRTSTMVKKTSLPQQKITINNAIEKKSSPQVAPYHCMCWLPLQCSFRHYYVNDCLSVVLVSSKDSMIICSFLIIMTNTYPNFFLCSFVVYFEWMVWWPVYFYFGCTFQDF